MEECGGGEVLKVVGGMLCRGHEDHCTEFGGFFLFVCFCVCVFVFWPFLGPLPQHMEIPRLGVELEL